MARPRLTIGTFGDITTRVMPSGRFEARTRYRDWDGRARQVQATGATAKAAEGALKAKLAERSLLRPTDSTLTPDSLFADFVAYWLNDINLEGRISKTTRNLYERNMRTLVSPALDSLTLREIGVARCDQFIKQLAKLSYSRTKQVRVVLRLALELAVPHEVRRASSRLEAEGGPRSFGHARSIGTLDGSRRRAATRSTHPCSGWASACRRRSLGRPEPSRCL